MGKRIIAILAAVLLALAGVVLVLLYAARADDRALRAQSPVTVFTTQERVPAGTSLREALRTEIITETQVPRAARPAGSLDSVDGNVASLVALVDLAPGQIVLGAAFGETPEGVRRVIVPTGMLAVSVELSDPARVGDFVTPGSRISIFATYGLRSDNPTVAGQEFNARDLRETSVWLPEIEVLAMGDESLTPTLRPAEDPSSAQSGNGSPTSLLTVAVTPEEAAKLIHGINEHILYLGLRSDEVQVGDEFFGDIARNRIPQ